MTDAPPSVSKLAGQLVYLFEDDPTQRDASVAELQAHLNRDDRVSRARATYPNDNDAEIQARIAEFGDRIPAADVEAAIAEAKARLGGSG